MREYCEFAPPARLADGVECLWVSKHSSGGIVERVVPDGCADIVYMRTPAKSALIFVGSMTRFTEFAQPDGVCVTGVRFRPGMWADLIQVRGDSVADRAVPLEDLWDSRARELAHRLDGADDPRDIVTLLAKSVPDRVSRTPLQKAIRAMERSHGTLPLDEAADEAGLSTRQFRRRSVETTGLTPKLLARILRFRRASSLASAMAGRHAELAAECGYMDQSHLIKDFRQFAGRTPRESGGRTDGVS